MDSSWRILKNLFTSGFSLLLLQSGYFGITSVISSVAIEGGLGVVSQSVMYCCLCFASTFLTFALMKIASFKTLMCCSMLMTIPHIAAVYKITWYSFIPAAFIMGIGDAIYFPAASAYVSQLAMYYNNANKKSARERTTSTFFGVFMIGNQLGHVLGSLLLYFILSQNGQSYEYSNITNINLCSNCCGINFHDRLAISGNTKIVAPDAVLLNTLTSVLIAVVVAGAAIVLFFVDHLPNPFKQVTHGFWFHVTQPIKLLHDPRMVFILPFEFFSGLQIAFISSDFTKAYISCEFGIHMIGLVMTCFGVCGALGCIILGILCKWFPRQIVYTFCCALHFATIIVLFNYDPSSEHSLEFVFLLASSLAICDAFWQSQTKALFGILFYDDKEAAFSFASTIKGLGQMTSFAYSAAFHTFTKLCILTAILILSYAGYVATEIIQKRRKSFNLEIK